MRLECEGGGTVPVPVVDLCRDLLLQLHQVVLGQRPRHDLGAVLHEAVHHLLEAPEQGGFVHLLEEHRLGQVWFLYQ